MLRIRTPEGVPFSFPLASPVSRMAAWAIDKLIVSAAWSLVSTLLGVLRLLGPDLILGISVVGYFVVSTGYTIYFEWQWGGQTLGKRLVRLRVMDESGLPLKFSQIVVRNILRIVDSLPVAYLVGGVTTLLNARAQRLGDIAAATIVVHEPPNALAGFSKLVAAKYNSLRTQRHVVARLRDRTSPALAHAALRAVLGREQFDPEARVELFRQLAQHFREVAAVPVELTEGLADEQFVRNIVEVLYLRPELTPAPEPIAAH
ncbi:MAG TPA: RDD family protein [Candidatus Didemnitutus sp.]|nr:RDD family protein [Candidatus Didemnitutus sp.]